MVSSNLEFPKPAGLIPASDAQGPGQPTYQIRVLILIFAFLFLRAITASVLELGNDEAYYWLYSQDLRWNYFDHPPLVAVWIRLFTLNGWLDHVEGIIRSGSVIGCAFSTWFLFKAVSLIQDKRAGWFAACLFNASLYAGIVAGILVMPDSPQIFFWTFCLWQIARLVKDEQRWTTWVLFGLASGFCIMSKIHGIFLWIGLGAFILFAKREWLKLTQLYVALGLSLLIMSPIFLWNIEYDFASWHFHSERIDISQPIARKESFWVELLLQIFINNPVTFFLILSGFYFFWRKKFPSALLAYNFIALPLALLTILLSLFRDIWFHWSGPAYTTLVPLAAITLAGLSKKSFFPPALKWSTAFFTGALAIWPLIIHFYPGTFGSRNPPTLGYGDVSLDKFGWRRAGQGFATLYFNQVSGQKHSSRIPIICPTWWGAHVEYYFGRPTKAPVIGLGTVQQLHHYAWLNTKRLHATKLDTAYLIHSSIEDSQVNRVVKYFYHNQQLVSTIPVFRYGRKASNFYVLRLTGWRGKEENLATVD